MGVDDQAEQSRVLVVDDEPNIVDVIWMALRHHEFTVETAASGGRYDTDTNHWRSAHE